MTLLKKNLDFDPSKDVPDLTGKVVVVTGSTSGIGLALTKQLARKGANVYLAARSESKATGAIAQIEIELAKSGVRLIPGQLEWARLDLDDPKEAYKCGKALAERIKSKYNRLDVLVNNASISFMDYEDTSYGIQKIMIINHFSTAAFTEALLPVLKPTSISTGSDVRIVNVASAAHSLAPDDTRLAKPEDCNPSFKDSNLQIYKRYAVTKLAVIWYTRMLQKHLAESEDGKNILCMTLHPGEVQTQTNIDHARTYRWPMSSLLAFLIHLFYYSVDEGTYTPLYVATSPAIRSSEERHSIAANKNAGAYFEPVKKHGKLSPAAQDDVRAEELWLLTRKLLVEWGCT